MRTLSDSEWRKLIELGWQPPIHKVSQEIYDTGSEEEQKRGTSCQEPSLRHVRCVAPDWDSVTCTLCLLHKSPNRRVPVQTPASPALPGPRRSNVIEVDFRSRALERSLKEDVDDFRKRDFPTRCQRCRRWMRYKWGYADSKRVTSKSRYYIPRRPSPHAGHCVECAVRPCSKGCDGCKHYKQDVDTGTFHLAGCMLSKRHVGACEPLMKVVPSKADTEDDGTVNGGS